MLTKRQKQTLDYIILCKERHDQSPTLAEIADGIGSKKQHVKRFVAALERKGIIKTDPYQHRSIKVL